MQVAEIRSTVKTVNCATTRWDNNNNNNIYYLNKCLFIDPSVVY